MIHGSKKNGVFSNVDWVDWTRGIYKQFGQAWREREGQDHFYREEVVVPAVLSQIGNVLNPKTIVDLGCGDGHFTQLIEAKVIHSPNGHGKAWSPSEREIFLVERDSRQLDVAMDRNYVGKSIYVQADLVSEDWENHITASETLGPLAAFSIFTIQEMPDVYPFLRKVAFLLKNNTLPSGSSFIAVVVHPDFAEFLYESGKMQIVDRSVHTNPQWSWAAAYPITVGSGEESSQTILLPYFHRTALDLQLAAEACGLVLSEQQSLSLPYTQEAVDIFGDTVYGESIIGRDSSMLLTFHLA